MGQETTITSISMGAEASPAASARPQLVLIAICDLPQAPSSRHLLDDVDEVRFGRGERSVARSQIDGQRVLELRVPDRRMSADHGRLVRGPSGWVLDDPNSKNGAVVDGTVTRRSVLDDGAVVELGHSFFVFREAPVEAHAAADVDDGALTGGATLQTYDGALAEQFATLARIAPTEVSVLLQGETGTGKELVARALHDLSGRRGAFVAVNCGALPPSLIEAELFGHRRGAFTGAVGERLGLVRSADGGTLFLDEVGELPAASQAAFLRVLQEREVVPVGVDHPVKVDVRLCAATLRDLEALVDSGQFRRDLYARLFGLTLVLPPLRERRVDLGLLTRRLLARIPGGTSIRLAPSALRALLRHDWALNIRELEKVLTTAVALATEGAIEATHLPEALRRPPPTTIPPPAAAAPAAVALAVGAPPPPAAPRDRQDELRDQLVGLLTVHEGNVVAVSRALNTRRAQVYRWLRRFGLEVKAFRR
ncbi:MAG TPA: sigma 54-interacting transcriptional regulator [Kofleriaceae bacterium]|nr:sigma 54-interacting transcriptional regulator [Kofleriaceae bacterium]